MLSAGLQKKSKTENRVWINPLEGSVEDWNEKVGAKMANGHDKSRAVRLVSRETQGSKRRSYSPAIRASSKNA